MPNKKLIAWQKATNALAQEFCTNTSGLMIGLGLDALKTLAEY